MLGDVGRTCQTAYHPLPRTAVKRRLVIDSPQFDPYFSLVYRELVEELSANSRITEFTRNSDLIGAYAEASIHRLAKRVLSPYRVSTGAVISPELFVAKEKIPQIDLIAWTPAPLPALFEVDEFAFVPRRSVIGVIEIKRSNYSGVGGAIARVLDRIDDLTSDRLGFTRRIEWGLGVVTLLEHRVADPALEKQMRNGRTVALLRKAGKRYVPDENGVRGFD